MTLKAIIFDVDGTLAETADVRRAAFNQAFTEVGLDWVWNRAVYAQVMACALPGAELEYYTAMRHPEMFNRLERNGWLERIPRRANDIYLGLLEAGAAPLRPGVARLMAEALSEGVRLALCSTGPRAEAEILLFNRFGREMLDALSASVSAEDLQGTSPVQAYRRTLERLGVPASSAAAFDDSARGVAAAASLGLCVIAAPSLYTLADRFVGARLVISDLGHPAAPFAVLDGMPPPGGHMSLAALRGIHGQATGMAVQAA
ncbi:MAG: HAD family hydrolase [Rhodobacteraceae bacterium]|nr:HAD family hydrolase [Paracoccaceae bacterium]